MIGWLSGTILEAAEGRLTLLVGAGVGYDLLVPQRAEYQTLSRGDKAEFHIHTHVREDALDLFGFLSREERELYLTVLLVNGVGPKLGLALLTHASPESLIAAILDADRGFLVDLPGVGKKTAERMILELGDPLRKRLEQGRLKAPTVVAGRKAVSPALLGVGPLNQPLWRDAKAALLGLGYRDVDVTPILEAMAKESESQDTGEIVRGVLRALV